MFHSHTAHLPVIPLTIPYIFLKIRVPEVDKAAGNGKFSGASRLDQVWLAS